MVRVLAGILALLLASCCASKPAPPPEPAQLPSAPPSTAGPGPFTDQELVQELAREGVGTPRESPSAPPSHQGEELPTEIRQTPRGVVVTFRHILFAFDSAGLSARARLEIERMAAVLNHPRAIERRVMVEGHADAIGTEAYNLALSRRRAQAVAQELVARGVRRDRLTVEGYGKQRPVAPNTMPDGRDNPAGRALNRRVEAVVASQEGTPR
jgi:outer membrane protein OmpA-like peptidoglycan-associated protein